MSKSDDGPLRKKAADPGRSSGERRASRRDLRTKFPIVGIGASAGGLEAIELFLKAAPADGGLAYVVVQHLDPNHPSVMAELIRRVTEMPVFQIEDRMRIEPNCVYAIPPNKDVSILHGVLHTFDLSSPRGLHMPIDHFFRSLAEDRAESAIGVVLSGTGADGTQGLRAIRGKAGLTLVQAPASAQFDGMPLSAIGDGHADIVAAPEELPSRILEYLLRAPLLAAGGDDCGAFAPGDLEKIVILLRSRTGNDFSLYKKSTLRRRVERRMGIHGVASADSYVRFVQENPQELDLLFKELLIGVTSFFRDAEAWEALSESVLRPLLASVPGNRCLRAWSAGCSTGEEAYSLAIAFMEARDGSPPDSKREMKIFATDLDKDAIDKARQGCFPPGIAADLSPERLERFFTLESCGYRVRKEVREMVVFAPQNVIMEPPFTKLDLVCCRNLLIYLAPEQQRKFLPLLHYALNPGACLFLGSAESIGPFDDLFAPLDIGNRIFRRLDSPTSKRGFEIAGNPSGGHRLPAAAGGRASPASIQDLADRVLLQRFSPAAVLTNPAGDIVYISGKTGRFLEPAAGKANWNVMAMARKEIRTRLESAFAKALRGSAAVSDRVIEVACEGGSCFVDLSVHKLEEPEGLKGFVMIVFAETRPPEMRREAGPDDRADELERELLEANDELRILREGMQASQEELRSSNEELQSTNEELQSTVEELTSSREEMQSLNEELQTVNSELQSKLDDLIAAGDDVKELLDSTDIAVLFMDGDLRVKRYTKRAATLIRLIPADVGRVVTDISTELVYPEFAEDCARAIRDLASVEREAPARDGSWFAVRIMPHQACDRSVDIVVVTFIDITRMKRFEAATEKG